MKEAQVFDKTAHDAHDVDGLGESAIDVLDDESELELAQGSPDPTSDFRICIRDTQHGLAEASFGVEDAGEETLVPVRCGCIGPSDKLPYFVDASTRLIA